MDQDFMTLFDEFYPLLQADDETLFKEFAACTKFNDFQSKLTALFCRASKLFKVSVTETLDDFSQIQIFGELEKKVSRLRGVILKVELFFFHLTKDF